MTELETAPSADRWYIQNDDEYVFRVNWLHLGRQWNKQRSVH